MKRIVLVTTLKDNDPDLFKKANSLHSLVANCISCSVEPSIQIDNKLHGKIYISCKNNQPQKGIITSANFTDRGLNHNHEWGILSDDADSLKTIISDITKVSSHALTLKEIENIVKKIDNYTHASGVPKKPTIKLEISDIISVMVTVIKPGARYFIKPVGDSEDTIPPTHSISSDIEKMHFAKRPNSVRVGDILICYAVGSTKLLGYFEVGSDPYVWDSSYRWSWEVKAKNLCPRYSDTWATRNNTISTILASFNDKYPVTFIGGKTLGALQFGSDKIQLSDEFAQHVIKIIEGRI